MHRATSKAFTPVFRSKLAIFAGDAWAAIEVALGEIMRRSAMEDYPEVPCAAYPAAEALERVLERCSGEVHWYYRRMNAAQLGREFARALNAVGEHGSIGAYEEHFRSRGSEGVRR
jgi:hypothetical protein